MPLIGGKNAKKKSSSSTTKRHFTVVIGNKEHGLYVSSSPSSAARKAVSKLCATDKKKKVEFQIREITQGSKKKTYGPYLGAIEKLDKPIELKGRVIKYKPVAKLLGKKTKTGVKKGGMRGGGIYECYTKIKGTNHTFSLNKSSDMYIIYLYYHVPNNNSNNTFSLKRIQEEPVRFDNSPPENVDAFQLCIESYRGTLPDFLNKPENKRNLRFTYSTETESKMSRKFKWFLEEFVPYLPHVQRNDLLTLRINDTFVNGQTNVDADGYRIPYPNNEKLVEQIMSKLDS